MISKKIDAFWEYLQGLSNSRKTSLIILILSILSLLIFAFVIATANILPVYMVIVVITALAVTFEILYFLMFHQKINRVVRVISDIVCSLMAIVLVIASFYIHATVHLFEKIQVGDTEKIEYSVLVKKENTKLKGLGYIANQNIGLYNDANTQQVKEYLEPEIAKMAGGNFGMNFVIESSLYNLAEQFLNDDNKLDVICLSQSQIQILSDKIENFAGQTKSIDSFELNIPTYKTGVYTDASSNKPFVLYLSVVDRFNVPNNIEQQEAPYGEYDRNLRKFRGETQDDTHGYSNINQLIVVNSNVNKILILNVPADYFVKTDEISETGDTLAEAGLIGIKEGMDDLEQLFGVKINYYLKTTFDDLEPLMRELGETNYDINSEAQKQDVLNVIPNRLSSPSILW